MSKRDASVSLWVQPDTLIKQGISARSKLLPAMRAAREREVGTAGEIASFKNRVCSITRLGTGDPALRARYGARLELLRGYNIDTACRLVDAWYRDEQALRRKFLQIPYVPQPSRLSLEVLRELRLILRCLRRYYPSWVLAPLLQLVLGRDAEERA
jgi:hypothetical protein